MSDRTVALIVEQPGNCPLLRKGDRFFLNDREMMKPAGLRFCAPAICSIYPKIRDILATLPPENNLPDDYLLCEHPGCDAAFRMEFAQPGPEIAQGTTRRLERAGPKTQIIRPEPFLKRLPKELADEVISICTLVDLEPGEVVLRQGMVGKHLYIVHDGEMEVVRRPNDTDETVLVTLGPGECFGEMSILTGEVTSAEVRAKGRAYIHCLHKDRLEPLLAERPMLSRTFSKLLAERLKATNVSLESELSRGILGKLSMISLVDLIQTLHQSRRTGTLVLSRVGAVARLGFRNGALRAASNNEILGEEAFFSALLWKDGEFCFEQTEPAADDPGAIKGDTMMLMMEGLRRMDEAKANSDSAQ